MTDGGNSSKHLTMKKILTLLIAVLCVAGINAKTIYLNTGGSELWNKDGAVFFVHSWTGTDGNITDIKMTAASGDVYRADNVPDGNEKIIFVRMPEGSESLNWDSKWNQTADLEIPSGMDCYTITGWDADAGTWSAYGDGNGNQGDNQGGNQGGSQGGLSAGDKDYFLKGFCNGKDIETPTADELFENGTLTYTFTGDNNYHLGYFFILVCEPGQVIGEQYMTTEYVSGVTHAKMVQNGSQKFGVPEGTVTFYLYDNGDGSLELSTEPLAGKTLVGSGSNALENTAVQHKAVKFVRNGQIFIRKGNTIYNALGIVVE